MNLLGFLSGGAKHARLFESDDETPVVGEVHYQASLKALSARHTESGGNTIYRGLAALRPEPTNPHDANAIQVLVDGNLVGYLDRDTAGKLQSSLIDIEKRLGVYAVVPCRISGGGRRSNGEAVPLGVVLNFAPGQIARAAKARK